MKTNIGRPTGEKHVCQRGGSGKRKRPVSFGKSQQIMPDWLTPPLQSGEETKQKIKRKDHSMLFKDKEVTTKRNTQSWEQVLETNTKIVQYGFFSE
jgi:hypothetical protein